MTDDTPRKSGIKLIGDIPWGTHLCQFYSTKRDLLDILVPYFKAGLLNNEFCMWVTSEPLDASHAKSAMQKAMPNFSRYLKKGQIEIISYKDWYVKGGSFNKDRVLNDWVQKLNEAFKKGFSGLRLTGNTFWLEKKDWKNFAEYERAADSVIRNYKMLAICTYSLDRCDVSKILDVVANHEFTLIKREGEWHRFENSKRQQIKNALLESEDLLKKSQAIAHLGSWELDLVKNKLTWSDEVYRIFGLKPQEFGATYEAFLERIHPDDRNAVDKAYSGSISEGRDTYEIEHRVIRKDTGEIRVVHEKCQHFRDESGKIIRSVGMVHDITERKRNEEKIEMISRFPSENPSPIMRISYSAEIMYANQAGQKLLNIWNKKIGDNIPEPIHDIVYKSLNRGIIHSTEVKAGKRVYLFNIVPIKEKKYVNLYGTDITEKKQAEEALVNAKNELETRVQERTKALRRTNELLEKSQKRYAELWDEAPVAYHVLDKNGIITQLNKTEAKMLGYKAIEMIGKSIFDFILPEQRTDAKKRFKLKLKGRRVAKKEGRIYVKKDGEKIYVEIDDKIERNKRGTVAGVRTTMRDITERRLVEIAQAEAEKRLIESYKHLGTINRKISLLLDLEKTPRFKKKREIADYILNMAINISQADFGFLYKYEDDFSFRLLASSGMDEKELNKLKIVSENSCHHLKTLVNNQTRITASTDDCDPGAFNSIDNLNWFIIIPFSQHKELLGFLFLGFSGKKRLSNQELEFYDIFSMHASSALLQAGIV